MENTTSSNYSETNANDPYAPPSAQVAAPVYEQTDQAPLANRVSRLVAQILNVMIMIPGAALCAGTFAVAEAQGGIGPVGIICVVLGTIYLIALLVINLRLLASNGQSLGKKWAKVKIVRLDGSPVSLGRLVALRYIVTALIGSIPFLGNVYSLVNILMIFREDRRCIHDMIADTKVVVA